jgi:hypothetical protein
VPAMAARAVATVPGGERRALGPGPDG